MIRQGSIVLRAREAEDVEVLHRELYEDVEGRSRSDRRPWRPLPVGTSSPYTFAFDPDHDDRPVFSVVEAASGQLAGIAALWGLDSHNRNAHLGMSLRPGFRGRGLGTDVVRALCVYGFTVRNLFRLQIDTLGDNAAMIGAARRNGFVLEGTMRKTAWSYGRYLDEVVLGLLLEEWTPPSPELAPHP